LAPNAALWNKQIILHYFTNCVTVLTLAPNDALGNQQIILHYFIKCVIVVMLAPNDALYNKQIIHYFRKWKEIWQRNVSLVYGVPY
jgi:hypothetical protein